jgi:hypothetical protein
MKSINQVRTCDHRVANFLTEDENVLFREDSFALRAVSRLVFGDVGRRYLDRLTVTLIKSILDVPYQLSLSTFEDKIVEIVDEFIAEFAKSHLYCPVYVSLLYLFNWLYRQVREVLAMTEVTVNKKFGKNSMVLDFLFSKFICPAIVNPQRNGLISEDEEVPLNSLKNFVLISRILSDITQNATEKYYTPEMKDCISRNYETLVEGMNTLLDVKKIEKARTIIEASTVEVVFTFEDKRAAEVKLREVLDSIFKKSSPSTSPGTLFNNIACMSSYIHEKLRLYRIFYQAATILRYNLH